MNASILLMTVTWVTGGPVMAAPQAQPQVVYSRPVAENQVVYSRQSAEKPTVFSNMKSRLNQLFGKDQPVYSNSEAPCQKCQQVQYVYPAGQPAVITMEPPQANTTIRQASAREFVPGQAKPQLGEPVGVQEQAQEHVYQVKSQFQKKIGRADDCSWVTGQLFYVHADGGRWILRYASIDEEDKYGGSVVLAPAVNMKNFREGDLVSITGHLLNEGRASKFLGGPLYRVETIDMMDRAD